MWSIILVRLLLGLPGRNLGSKKEKQNRLSLEAINHRNRFMMKILIYGAGIVGSTYGWQLSETGHDVTVLVKKGKKQFIEEEGIHINCTDFRGNEKQVVQTTFRPTVIEDLSPENNYEFIIVSVNNVQLKEVLPVLSKGAGNANILFFQNNWDDFDEINKCLAPEQYFFGFPFMVGGGRDENGIKSLISGLKQSQTLLGEANGETTPRLKKMAGAFRDANLKPVITNQIIPWLITHYVVAAGLSAGVMKAGGSMKTFTSDSNLLRESFISIREGLDVCRKRGVDPKKVKATAFYTFPFFISIPIAKKIFSKEVLSLMFEGHVGHAPDEMKKMFQDILERGEQYNINMPVLKSYRETLIN
jgi:ketopantoate reductase